MGDPVGGCAANNALGFPGFGKPKRKKIGLIKVLHLTFKTDHASTNPGSAMKDNNSDWEDTRGLSLHKTGVGLRQAE